MTTHKEIAEKLAKKAAHDVFERAVKWNEDHQEALYDYVAAEEAIEAAIQQALTQSIEGERERIAEWVDSRIEAEVTHRPDANVHKRTLAETWGQMKRFLQSAPPEEVKEETEL